MALPPKGHASSTCGLHWFLEGHGSPGLPRAAACCAHLCATAPPHLAPYLFAALIPVHRSWQTCPPTPNFAPGMAPLDRLLPGGVHRQSLDTDVRPVINPMTLAWYAAVRTCTRCQPPALEPLVATCWQALRIHFGYSRSRCVDHVIFCTIWGKCRPVADISWPAPVGCSCLSRQCLLLCCLAGCRCHMFQGPGWGTLQLTCACGITSICF